MKVTRVLHSSVNVAGRLDESRQFYQDLLGMDLTDRPDIPGIPGHWFEVAGTEVHLVDAPPYDAPIRPTDHHVCFAVDDIDAAIAELEASSIPYARGAQGSVVQIWLTDPSGNVIELQQERS
jgi:catechol 2,3-dioxygenase-like lactoylglutathione lyase family enzyme